LQSDEPVNLFDLIAICVLVLTVALGAWVGLFPQLLGLVGAAAGFLTALLGAGALQGQLMNIDQPMRAFVAAGGLLALTLLGEALGSALGSRLRVAMRDRILGALDAGGGMLVGLGQGILAIWIVGGLILADGAPGVASAASGSTLLQAIDAVLPPPERVAGSVVDLLGPTDFPDLFAGIEPSPAPPLELPGAAAVASLADSGKPSTVEVVAIGCGREQIGTGFFIADHVVVTNAHVVAGGNSISVSQDSASFRASLVFYDPGQDLAVLRVPESTQPPLRLARSTPGRGTRAAALGHPGGRRLTVIPAVVTTSFRANGPDIYDRSVVTRTIVEVRGQVQRGDSGGPLLTEKGVVGGIVFGASRTSSSVGYTISAASVATELDEAANRTRAVDSGGCLPE
jgi:S1-C subfamily serine protease